MVEKLGNLPLEPFLSEKLEDRVTNPNVLNGRKTREPASRTFSFRKTRGPGEKLGNRSLDTILPLVESLGNRHYETFFSEKPENQRGGRALRQAQGP